MKKLLLFVLSMALPVCLTQNLFSGDAKPVTITMAVGSSSGEKAFDRKQAEVFEKDHPGIKVNIMELPVSSDDQLAYLLQNIESKSSDIDISIPDVCWLGDVAPGMIDLKPYGAEAIIKTMYPVIADTAFVNNSLVAIPTSFDPCLLFYRKDLLKKYNLEPPKTWTDLAKAAYTIQEGERSAGNKDFVGYVWQGEAYEGLTCCALEWIASNDGGTIVSNNKKVTLNNPNAIEAVNMAASWIGTISPKGVLSMKEEDARAVFQSGNAAFMRNWPYVYVLGEAPDSKVKGKFDACPMPAGKSGKSTGCVGGHLMGVSKFSKHPKEAAEFVLFMTSEKVQKAEAFALGLTPSSVAVLNSPDIININPAAYKNYAEGLKNAVMRPATVTAPNYSKVSQIFYRAVFSVLSGNKDAETAIKEAAAEISKVTGFPEGALQ